MYGWNESPLLSKSTAFKVCRDNTETKQKTTFYLKHQQNNFRLITKTKCKIRHLPRQLFCRGISI